MNSENEATERIGAPRLPGVIETLLNAEIDAALARLQLARDEVHAEASIYPWVGEWPEVYEPFPLSVAFRARALELLDCLIGDGLGTGIEQLDEYIDELREVLPGTAGKPFPGPRAAIRGSQGETQQGGSNNLVMARAARGIGPFLYPQ